MLKSILVSVLVGLTVAQVPHLGKCPDVKVQENFDLNKYLGGWYEISKFFFFIEGQETCIKANYSAKADGHVEIVNTGLQPDGSIDEAIGDATVPEASEPAKFAVSFNNSPRVPYWVVKTDYDTYSLVWSCADIGGIVQADFAWILSRQKTLDAKDVTMLKDTLASFGVNTASFMETKQDCQN